MNNKERGGFRRYVNDLLKLYKDPIAPQYEMIFTDCSVSATTRFKNGSRIKIIGGTTKRWTKH